MDQQQLQRDLAQLASMAEQSQQRLEELAGHLRSLCDEMGELLDDPDLAGPQSTDR